MRAASSRMNCGVGRSGSPKPKLIESGNARSKNCLISVGCRPCIRRGKMNFEVSDAGVIAVRLNFPLRQFLSYLADLDVELPFGLRHRIAGQRAADLFDLTNDLLA